MDYPSFALFDIYNKKQEPQFFKSPVGYSENDAEDLLFKVLTNTSLTSNNETDITEKIRAIRFISYGIISSIIVSCGILGNFLTILILTLPPFKDVTYIYFRVLAICDLASLLFVISLLYHVQNPVTDSYLTASWFSHGEVFMTNIWMTVSVFVVLIITVDRYYSICKPVKFKDIHTKSHAYRSISASFIISCVLWIPICFIYFPKQGSTCREQDVLDVTDEGLWVSCNIPASSESFYVVYSWLRQIIISFIPIIVLTVLNILIIKEFRVMAKKRREMKRLSVLTVSNQPGVRSVEDRNIVFLLISIMVSFFITILPTGIFNALYPILDQTNVFAEVYRAIANNLEMLNHSLNFYLYILLSKPIRRSLSKIFSRNVSANDQESRLSIAAQKRLSRLAELNAARLQNDVEAESQDGADTRKTAHLKRKHKTVTIITSMESSSQNSDSEAKDVEIVTNNQIIFSDGESESLNEAFNYNVGVVNIGYTPHYDMQARDST